MSGDCSSCDMGKLPQPTYCLFPPSTFAAVGVCVWHAESCACLQVHIPGQHRRLPVVHNYGHGGSGVTLCWGCAIHAVELLKTLDLAATRSRL